VDSERLSAEASERIAELERRVEALRKANGELGRELLANASRRPRSVASGSRTVARLTAAESGLQRALAELDRLEAENRYLRAELGRLRRGYPGLLRRVRARLTGR
jgi:chromosome segregation ATPase